MKKIGAACTALLLFILVAGTPFSARCQTAEITQLVLDVEKLATLKNILSDMYKGYTILTNGYNTVKSISQGNFSLHQVFLDGLLLINPDIAKYKNVSAILADEEQILASYKASLAYFRSSGRFSLDEISRITATFDTVVKDAADVLDELTMLVTSAKLRMSDDERLRGIDRLYNNIEKQVAFTLSYADKVKVLTLQRLQSSEDVRMMQRLHGIN